MNSTQVNDILYQLEHRLQEDDQSVGTHLKGMLISRYLTYWDYLQIDTLLSLQRPKTDYPDEEIFIIYHQITELYFKLIRNELEQLCLKEYADVSAWMKRLKRVVRYYRLLCDSFEIMLAGMDTEEFKIFRTALIPASGFQSLQFRKIELMLSSLNNLVKAEERSSLGQQFESTFQKIYWKYGSRKKDGKKSLTLKLFEQEYDEDLLEFAHRYRRCNLWNRFQQLPPDAQASDRLQRLLRKLDQQINIHWKLSHYKAAASHIGFHGRSTGGTNWQRYLPPHFQRISFFPTLWSAQERAEWGKEWVMELLEVE